MYSLPHRLRVNLLHFFSYRDHFRLTNHFPGLSDVTKDDCLELINKYEPSEVLRSIPALGIDGFTKYLISDQCAIFNPIHSTVSTRSFDQKLYF